MNILAFIKSRISDMSLADLDRLAEETGVPVKTLHKIRYGETTDPRIGTLQPLLNYFGGCPNCDD